MSWGSWTADSSRGHGPGPAAGRPAAGRVHGCHSNHPAANGGDRAALGAFETRRGGRRSIPAEGGRAPSSHRLHTRRGECPVFGDRRPLALFHRVGNHRRPGGRAPVGAGVPAAPFSQMRSMPQAAASTPLSNWRLAALGVLVAAIIVTPFILLQQATRNADDADRKSTRLNSSHVKISYAVFC